MPPKKRKQLNTDSDSDSPIDSNNNSTAEQNFNGSGTGIYPSIIFELFFINNLRLKHTYFLYLTLLFILVSGESTKEPREALGGTNEMIMQLQIDGMFLFSNEKFVISEPDPIEINVQISQGTREFFHKNDSES